jgi:hypothetical protein
MPRFLSGGSKLCAQARRERLLAGQRMEQVNLALTDAKDVSCGVAHMLFGLCIWPSFHVYQAHLELVQLKYFDVAVKGARQ